VSGPDFQNGIRQFERSLLPFHGLSQASWVWQGKPGECSGYGREAITMRQVLLVIILVAAAFAGGAFVNGPGLQWVQNRLFRSLDWHAGDIASIDLKVTTSNDSTPDGHALSKPDANALDGPLAPIPSLITEGGPSSIRQPVEPTATLVQPKSKSVSKSAPHPELGSSQARPRLGLSPQVSPTIDSNIKPAGVPALAPIPVAMPANGNPAPAILEALSDLLPLNRPADGLLSPMASTSKSVGERNGDWEMIMRKMQTLGVSRFTIEGETGGRVVFSCLIPLAGRQAVAQRFEAEGNSLNQAAQAALRRIALWRAAQAATQEKSVVPE
jgi:hypothetical protein